MTMHDVAIVGAGPAGLALAIAAARRGLSVALFDARALPFDKACGEGLMPVGVEALERLEVLSSIPGHARSRIAGVRYHDGALQAAAPLTKRAYGIRRTVLAGALLDRARALGVEVHPSTRVNAHLVSDDRVTVSTAAGEAHARVLVGADGLSSRVRLRAGLDRPSRRPARFGHRRHLAHAPWTDHVEVYLGDGIEAYVTPLAHDRIGLAFLWHKGALHGPPSSRALLAGFPMLRERLGSAPFEASPAGAGPFAREASALAADRVVLLGDAAGYVDAISGEGLSLALAAALDLADALPEAIARRGVAAAFRPYIDAAERRYRRYALVASSLLLLSRRPTLRSAALAMLSRAPWLMAATVARATDLG